MKQEIYKKLLPNKTLVEVYRDASGDSTTWEVKTSLEDKNASKYFSARDKEVIEKAAQGRSDKFMERVKVYDALPDPTMSALLLVVDKFGAVDVHRYRLNAQNLPDYSNVEVIPLRRYELVPRDVQLLGETVQDVTTYEQKLIALSSSRYRNYDSYFIDILDLNKKTSNEFRISTTELKAASSEIEDESIQSLVGIPMNPLNLTKVLEAVQSKSTNASGKLVYKFSLLSDAFEKSVREKKKLNSDALFFVDIGGVPMIMFYTNLNEWYIAPETMLKAQEKYVPEQKIDELFSYR